MKVIVNNEKEKELLEKLFDVMYELDGISALENIDNEEKPAYLQSDEYRLIQDNLGKNAIVVDDREQEMFFDDDDCITGTCVSCKTATMGTSNGDAVSYSEYLRLMSIESQLNWLCEDCYNKGVHEQVCVTFRIKRVVDHNYF